MKSSNLFIPDLFTTYLLIIISIIASYIMPNIISSLIFILILFAFYHSKRDYIYLALLFFIIDLPGGLFYNKTEYIISVSIINISFAELFSLTAIFKYIHLLKRQQPSPFHKAYKLYFYYLIILIFYGIVFGMKISGTIGTGLGPYKRTIGMLIMLPLYLIIPIILKDNIKITRFVKLVFTFVLLNILFQFINIITGITIHQFLGGSVAYDPIIGSVRPVYGVYSSFFLIIMSLFLGNIRSMSKTLTNIALTISLISIVITATRGWMIASFFLVGLYYFTTLKMNVFKYLILIIPIALIFFFITQIGVINKQFKFSLKRFSTLELLIEGDKTAGGTNSRLTDRSEPVMEQFYRRPLIGWGFTSNAFMTYDTHVGNQSMLMSGGIIGYFIFLLVLFKIVKVILKCKNHLGKYFIDPKHIHIFVIAIGGLFIIHSTSTDLFSYMAPTYGNNLSKIVFLSIIFSIIGTYINNSYHEFGNYKKHLDLKDKTEI